MEPELAQVCREECDFQRGNALLPRLPEGGYESWKGLSPERTELPPRPEQFVLLSRIHRDRAEHLPAGWVCLGKWRC